MQNIRVPAYAMRTLTLLEQAGFEAYFVGGCVRDSLLGSNPADWDIATIATPEQSIAVLEAKELRVLKTGLRHGTVTVVTDGCTVEVTTYREDGTYSDHRRPDSVSFSRSLKVDLARRDFSVNAMAFTPEKGIVDYFGGLEDLNKKCLRCVGDADARFREDALRILRALRFAATLGFTFAPDTADALLRHHAHLRHVSAERIGVEMQKLVCGRHAQAVLHAYPQVVQPFLHAFEVQGISALAPDLVPRLSLLLSCQTRTQAQETLRRLHIAKESRRRIDAVLHALSQPPFADRVSVYRMLGQLGEENVRVLLSVRQARGEDIAQQLTLLKQALLEGGWSRNTLAISGKDLIAEHVPEGKEIGRALDQMIEAVALGKVPNEREALLEHWRQTTHLRE